MNGVEDSASNNPVASQLNYGQGGRIESFLLNVLGVALQYPPQVPSVLEVRKGSWAWEQGIRKGHVLLQVDDGEVGCFDRHRLMD